MGLPDMPRRDRIKRAAAQAVTWAQGIKVALAVVAACGVVWGAATAWSKLQTTTEIADAETLDKLKSLERTHKEDVKSVKAEQKEIMNTVHAIDKTQAVIKHDVGEVKTEQRETNRMLRQFLRNQRGRNP